MQGNRTATRLSIALSLTLAPLALLENEWFFLVFAWLNFFAFHAIWFIPKIKGEPDPQDNYKWFKSVLLLPLSVFVTSGWASAIALGIDR